ncbi:hypothetical protein ACLUWO_04910 [Pseudoscardovia radai]|uniref:hypothetical protein n=1 Tax=Pseudoscardovia radai TaxID=987066 RepID=UPI0039961DA4
MAPLGAQVCPACGQDLTAFVAQTQAAQTQAAQQAPDAAQAAAYQQPLQATDQSAQQAVAQPVAQPQYAQSVQQTIAVDSAQAAQQQYAQQPVAQTQYAQPVAQPQYAYAQQPVAQSAAQPAAQPQYAQQPAQPQYAQPQYGQPQQYVQQTPRQTSEAALRLQADMKSPLIWQTIFAGVGIAFAAVVAMALVTLVFLKIFSPDASSAVSDIMSFSSDEEDAFSSKSFLWLLLIGLGGSLHASASGSPISMTENFSAIGLPAIGMVIGAAFGVYLLARKGAFKVVWTGLLGSVIGAVASGLVSLILGAISAVSTEDVTVTFATAHTFLSVFIFVLLGELAGFALAQSHKEEANVFLACRQWRRHARGWQRTLVEFFEFVFAVFAVLGFVALLVLQFKGRSYDSSDGTEAQAIAWLFAIIILTTFGTLVVDLLVIASFAGISYSLRGVVDGTIDFGWFMSKNHKEFKGISDADEINDAVSKFSWVPWVLLVCLVLALVYVALREAVRNQYDPAKAGWDQSWQAPAVACGIALVYWLVFPGLNAENMLTFKISPLIILTLPACVFIVEALSRTLGTAIMTPNSPLYSIALGGAVAVDGAAPAAAPAAQMTAAAPAGASYAAAQPTYQQPTAGTAPAQGYQQPAAYAAQPAQATYAQTTVAQPQAAQPQAAQPTYTQPTYTQPGQGGQPAA